MTSVPPLDLHAHVDVSIAAHELDELGAVVFGVTRSLEEASTAIARTDLATVWGVGCHPALARSHTRFDPERFADLLESTCFAGELGLDGTSRVSLDRQRATLRFALDILAERPRVTSLHSAGAAKELLEELEQRPIAGAVLHWWLGSPDQTRRAVAIGCYFSVNIAGVRRNELLAHVPLDRILTETDHPFGDRRSKTHLPGNVTAVEDIVGKHFGRSPAEIRTQMWHNLGDLVSETGSGRLVPRGIRTFLAAL